MKKAALFFLMMLVSTAPLKAETGTAPPSALQALVNSQGYQANLGRLFSKLPPNVFQRCSTLVSNGSQVTVLAPVIFAKDGYPTSGFWKQSFPISGCGNDTIINIYFRGQPDENITSIIGIPGQTHADLTLQRDALDKAYLVVHVSQKDCTDMQVRNSTYDGPVGSTSTPARKPWTETWTILACGRTYRIPLTFVPDATGTTISAKVMPPVD